MDFSDIEVGQLVTLTESYSGNWGVEEFRAGTIVRVDRIRSLLHGASCIGISKHRRYGRKTVPVKTDHGIANSVFRRWVTPSELVLYEQAPSRVKAQRATIEETYAKWE